MKWFKNMKIRAKLLLAFLIVVVLAAVIAAVGIIALNNAGDTYTHLLDYPSERRSHFAEAEFLLMSARRDYVYMGMLSGHEEILVERLASANVEIDKFITELEVCRTNLLEDSRFDQAYKANQYAEIDKMIDLIRSFQNDGLYPMYQLMLTGAPTIEEIFEAVQRGTDIASELSYLIRNVLEDNIRIVRENNLDSSRQEDSMRLLLIIVASVAAVIAVILAFYVSGVISKPLIPFNAFMEKAGHTGDISLSQADVETIGKYALLNDETGRTIASAAEFVKRVTEVSDVMQEIANGDLTAHIELLSDKDVMGYSIVKMIENLNNMFGDIMSASGQVSTGSKQVADGAQSLAQGSTEQAASIQQLSSSISEIANKTKSNTDMAFKAADLAGTIKTNAEKGSRQMDEMIGAVGEINDASQSISKVIKTIDDIAFQTNILALNAAVEAARAGQHGKGFAVVAEEVRNLAAKSAEAAKETGGLIENSIEKANLGVRIAGETASSLEEIVSGINESDKLIGEIARSSEEQTLGITQINTGIDQVAQVVQQNSATAEESAAASEEMSSQSSMLQGLISKFRLKDANKAYCELPPSSEHQATQRTSPPRFSADSANFDQGSFGKY